MKEITILEELKNLLPPLTDEEYSKLEESILVDGVLSPLILWNDILVDGHHRYEICRKHRLAYAVKNVALDTLEDAKFWAWQHQEGRRNLTPFHRAELALRFKDAYAAKAKERQGNRNDLQDDNFVENSPQSRKTRQALAKDADVSENTIAKVEYITEHADEETKNKLRRGEKGCSIHKEYGKLKKQQARKEKSEPEPPQQEDLVTTLLGHYTPGRLDDHDYGPKTQLKPIPRNRPDVLIGNLIAFFPKEFVPNAAREIFRMLHDRYGKKITKPLVAELYKKYGK